MNRTAEADTETGLIAWFAKNHVAANLLMILIIAAGVYSIVALVKVETFPKFEPNTISIRVPYRGAAPEETELGVTVKVEEAVKSISGISEIRSVSLEGLSRVTLEVHEDHDLREVLDDVKAAVDGISTFPEEIERPVIDQSRYYSSAINVAVYGDLPDTTLKTFAERVQRDILALPEVSSTALWGDRPSEISIEIPEYRLREYGLTLQQVAQAIRNYSLDLPGGMIRAQTGDIRLRTKAQAYRGEEFGDIALLTNPDGTRILIRDLARITDGFAETAFYARFNGQPALVVSVNSAENENELDIAAAVRAYVAERTATLPDGVAIDTWSDRSYYLQGRLDMMLKNMIMGALLVFIILGLFLRPSVAFWVIVGLPVAFLGAMALMPLPYIDVSINVLSLFGFILVLGIVVDDAIIIAESAYSQIKKSGFSRASVVQGAKHVAIPSTFGVLTTVAAFTPMLFFSGNIAALTKVIAWITILCLIFSLVESKLILPAHLASMKKRRKSADREPLASRGLDKLRTRVYEPVLRLSAQHRYTTLSIFIAGLILIFGVLAGGLLRFSFFPNVDNDFLRVRFELQQGVPDTLSTTTIKRLQQGLENVENNLRTELDDPEVGIIGNTFAWTSNGTNGSIFVELVKSENRPISIYEVERRWRKEVGEIAGVSTLDYISSRSTGSGKPIALKILSNNSQELQTAATEITDRLKTYEGVYDVENSVAAVAPEIQLELKPQAITMGLALSDLARQVRQAFYGIEAQRIQRGNDEVRIMVRYPSESRNSIGDLENMWIRTPRGDEVPFSSVARAIESRGENVIRRIDGQRAATVSANVNLQTTQPSQIIKTLLDESLPEIRTKYPGIRIDLDGSSKDEEAGISGVTAGFTLALFAVYALLAIPLRSYLQPLIIMGVIPFGIFGAMIGHLVLDLTISMVSLSGIIALSGVIVNDGLIMVSFINRKVAQGMNIREAAIISGQERLRPILLTSLTTFFGLAPIMLEKSLQAQIVIPMAVSLGFGILFATLITLIMVPCLYLIMEDIKKLLERKRPDEKEPDVFPLLKS